MITAQLVKELREKTGAGMLDCKKALAEVNGDLEAAVDWLRKKGLAAAAKKAGRVAAEGLVGVHSAGTCAAVVEVNSETDFVARNDLFQQYVKTLAGIACEKGDDIEALKSVAYPGAGRTVDEELTHLVATIGENMTLRRVKTLSVSQGVVATYMHSATTEGLGRIGVLVALESAGDQSKLQTLGRQIAMHIAATSPQSARVEELDPALVEREKAVLTEQARASGRPEDVIQKMIEGRLRKYYEEVVLEQQVFVIDGQSRVHEVIAATAKELGHPITLKAFARFALGEGIEKEQVDFAAEVAAQLGKA